MDEPERDGEQEADEDREGHQVVWLVEGKSGSKGEQ